MARSLKEWVGRTDDERAPPRIRHREIRHSDDIEILEVTSPAAFATQLVAAP